MMDGLLFVLNEDKDENNCSTVMLKLEFTILISPNDFINVASYNLLHYKHLFAKCKFKNTVTRERYLFQLHPKLPLPVNKDLSITGIRQCLYQRVTFIYIMSVFCMLNMLHIAIKEC